MIAEIYGVLDLPIRVPSLNELLSRKRIVRGKTDGFAITKKRIESEVAVFARAQNFPKIQDAYFHFIFREKNKRRDPDNLTVATKFILDSLRKEGLIPGDGWKHVLGLSFGWSVDFDSPGVSVLASSTAVSPAQAFWLINKRNKRREARNE